MNHSNHNYKSLWSRTRWRRMAQTRSVWRTLGESYVYQWMSFVWYKWLGWFNHKKLKHNTIFLFKYSKTTFQFLSHPFSFCLISNSTYPNHTRTDNANSPGIIFPPGIYRYKTVKITSTSLFKWRLTFDVRDSNKRK